MLSVDDVAALFYKLLKNHPHVPPKSPQPSPPSSSGGEFTAGTCVFECTQAAAKSTVYVEMLT